MEEDTDETPTEGHMSSICCEHHLKKSFLTFKKPLLYQGTEDCELIV